MDLWATEVNFFAKSSIIETNTINYITGVLQGDCLSLMLFLLSTNPLSFPLSLPLGFKIGKSNNNKRISFFVDD